MTQFDANQSILRHHAKSADPEALWQHSVILHGVSGRGGALEAANIPQDYRHYTPVDAPPLPDQPKAKQFVDRYTELIGEHFKTGHRLKSLYIVSASPGTGKTTVACALLNEFVAVNYLAGLHDKPNYRNPAYFLDANEWQATFNLGVTLGDGNNYLRKFTAQLEKALSAQLCVIDDIGVSAITDGFRRHLHTLINGRMLAGKPTIYTSNVGLRELTLALGDDRMYDRVRDLCKELEFVGKSKRGVR